MIDKKKVSNTDDKVSGEIKILKNKWMSETEVNYIENTMKDITSDLTKQKKWYQE